jgi:hypothetical protein
MTENLILTVGGLIGLLTILVIMGKVAEVLKWE